MGTATVPRPSVSPAPVSSEGGSRHPLLLLRPRHLLFLVFRGERVALCLIVAAVMTQLWPRESVCVWAMQNFAALQPPAPRIECCSHRSSRHYLLCHGLLASGDAQRAPCFIHNGHKCKSYSGCGDMGTRTCPLHCTSHSLSVTAQCRRRATSLLAVFFLNLSAVPCVETSFDLSRTDTCKGPVYTRNWAKIKTDPGKHDVAT